MDDIREKINIANPANVELLKFYKKLEAKGEKKVRQEFAKNYYPHSQTKLVKTWLHDKYQERIKKAEHTKLKDFIHTSEVFALFWLVLAISICIFDHHFHILKFIHF